MQTTITEALADLKTIDKRIEKKRQFIINYCVRQEIIRDPLEKDGGSVTAIARELQAISDLERRKIAIRRAIANANAAQMLTIEGQGMTISDWLVWRREVAPLQKANVAAILGRVNQVRQEAQRKGQNVVQAGQAQDMSDVVVHLNEKALSDEAERIEVILGALDGQLSLKNATTTIDV